MLLAWCLQTKLTTSLLPTCVSSLEKYLIQFILYTGSRFLIYAEMATLDVQLSKQKRNCANIT